jgi:hypothetical protein
MDPAPVPNLIQLWQSLESASTAAWIRIQIQQNARIRIRNILNVLTANKFLTLSATLETKLHPLNSTQLQLSTTVYLVIDG